MPPIPINGVYSFLDFSKTSSFPHIQCDGYSEADENCGKPVGKDQSFGKEHSGKAVIRENFGREISGKAVIRENLGKDNSGKAVAKNEQLHDGEDAMKKAIEKGKKCGSQVRDRPKP
jgi:hypothetical protein